MRVCSKYDLFDTVCVVSRKGDHYTIHPNEKVAKVGINAALWELGNLPESYIRVEYDTTNFKNINEKMVFDDEKEAFLATQYFLE